MADKFQFVPKKRVLNNDGTEIDDTDALLVCGVDVLLALPDNEEWELSFG